MTAVRRTYDPEILLAAALRVLEGESGASVSKATGILYKTLMKHVRTIRRGGAIAVRRRGPPPLFPAECEQHLVDWVIGMQMIGFPLSAEDIVAKANEISATIAGRDIGVGWYKRFLGRHSELTGRVAQNLSRARNEVSKEYIDSLFWTMAKLVIEDRVDATRIFNVDETAFLSRAKSRRVVAVRGSPNVWSKTISTSFHLTIVACASAAGLVIPPTFLLPGERVRREILDACAVPDAVVTTTKTGFINGSTFETWLRWFASHVPDDIQRPLVLVMDGYRCHYSYETVEVAASVGVLLVCLPANATHLLQPLDVSVFASMKKHIRRLVHSHMLATGTVNITKTEAIRIGSEAWLACNFSKNIVSGFKTTGLYPPSRVNMDLRFDRFKRNGAARGRVMASWLKFKPVVEETVLALPAPTTGKRKRKTVDVAGRLLTAELLHSEDAPTAQRPRVSAVAQASIVV